MVIRISEVIRSRVVLKEKDDANRAKWHNAVHGIAKNIKIFPLEKFDFLKIVLEILSVKE